MPMLDANPRTSDATKRAADDAVTIPVLRASSAQSTATANWLSVVAEGRARAAREVFGSDLDHLTDDDRRLIHAVTGEVIWQGQVPHERPLSAFAMQIAVDRRTAYLHPQASIDVTYLTRTGARLRELAVPSNPFTGDNLARARAHLAGHGATSPQEH